MADNNPAPAIDTPLKAPAQAPTINIQNKPQTPPPSAKTQSPGGQHQTINIYTQQSSQERVPQQTQSPPQQQQQSVHSTPHPQRGSLVPYYAPPTPAEDNRFKCYECLKIVQTLVCVFFIVLGVLWSVISFFADDWKWRFFRRKDDDDDFWNDKFDHHLLDSAFWYHVFASCFGIIGSMGEVMCCQIFYAILVTPFLPYCLIPWIIVVGMFKEWDRPRYHYAVHHY